MKVCCHLQIPTVCSDLNPHPPAPMPRQCQVSPSRSICLPPRIQPLLPSGLNYTTRHSPATSKYFSDPISLSMPKPPMIFPAFTSSYPTPLPNKSCHSSSSICSQTSFAKLLPSKWIKSHSAYGRKRSRAKKSSLPSKICPLKVSSPHKRKVQVLCNRNITVF